MKKTLVFCILLATLGLAYAYEKNIYKEELKERGWLYGCTPSNWSLSEPVRGGFNYAAMKGEIEIMELEVKAGLDITKCGTYMPAVLIQKDQSEALDFLFKNGYDVDGEYLGYTHLLLATYYKKPEMVDIIINNGADVNKVSKNYTPLNFAIKRKQPEIVEMLLKAGAKPDDKTQKLVTKTKNEEIKALFEDENTVVTNQESEVK